MDLEIILPFRGISGLFLRDDASVIAMATVFKGDEDFFVFTEAASSAALAAHLDAGLQRQDVTLELLSGTMSVLCLLGPKAEKAMSEFGGDDILGLPYLSFENNALLGLPLFRMGTSGEYEYRMLCPNDAVAALEAQMLEKAAEFDLAQISPDILGLLMLEMRSLQLSDLSDLTDPITAGLHWMVDFRKEGYPGADLLHVRKAAPQERPLMLLLDAGASAAPGDQIAIEGRPMGRIIRAAFSPHLGRHVALVYAQPDFGWVGVQFDLIGPKACGRAEGVSAPLFVTQTVSRA
jgi:aminomethyltransferase